MKPYYQKEEQGYLGSTMKALPSVANQPQEPRLPRERPILFSSEMVRAILDGRKTQTRRVAKLPADVEIDNWGLPFRCVKVVGGWHREGVICPFGQPGDRLWVREAFCAGRAATESGYGIIPWLGRLNGRDYNATQKIAYAADTDHWVGNAPPRWRPSIHMPRWASRIALEITGVRVERVQDIGGQDAIAEGIERRDDYYLGGPHRRVKGKTKVFTLAWQAYKDIWNNLNAKRGYGWDVNPWVWVIEFKRVEARDA